MTWRQPIPVVIPELEGDPFGETMFQKLLIMASDRERMVNVGVGTIKIKRGQCVIGAYTLAKAFGMKKSEHRRVTRKLSQIEKVNHLITKRKSLNCSVITILNYDSWIKMTDRMTYQRPIDDRSMTTNQIVKSEKNDKSIDFFDFEKTFSPYERGENKI